MKKNDGTKYALPSQVSVISFSNEQRKKATVMFSEKFQDKAQLPKKTAIMKMD